MTHNIHLLSEKLKRADRVAVLTGAGVSAESGVPTFRGADGLWRQYRATDLATPEAFERDSALVWEFYNWRRELLAPLNPNAAHRALVELEQRFSQFTLITQNIDGLHQQAGSRKVVELHGNIWYVRCTICQGVSEDRRVPLPGMPVCNACGGLLRPHVVWFGEMLEPEILEHAYASIGECQVMLVVGTSALVQPAASMGLYARRQGAFVAEINLESTPNSDLLDLSLLGKAGEILPKLVDSLG
ncbi:MAG TPA: NAD-dependent deacylase [Syntrophobacteraceae bacterium]|nr:NAD-dependent deacylase [Syntrophobacteraceae bacterium]HBZ57431.1 NAD-dependent deacylase [Syntrophobacteraceae bacterium]